MPPPRAARLILVDPHPVVRQGLHALLADAIDLRVVGEADSAHSALATSRQRAWDVIALELALPDRDGYELIRQLRAERPRAAILVFAAQPAALFAVRAVRAGATGCLDKRADAPEILTALRTLVAGRKYFSAEAAQALAAEVGGENAERPHETLSHREFQTLRLLASGHSVTAAAEKLALSVKTVSMYRTRLLAKMGMKTNAELTHYAIRNGLVD